MALLWLPVCRSRPPTIAICHISQQNGSFNRGPLQAVLALTRAFNESLPDAKLNPAGRAEARVAGGVVACLTSAHNGVDGGRSLRGAKSGDLGLVPWGT